MISRGTIVYWNAGAPVDTLSSYRRFASSAEMEIAGLKCTITYYFAVTVVDLSGNESAFSVQQSGKPLNTTSPSPPTGVNIAAENAVSKTEINSESKVRTFVVKTQKMMLFLFNALAQRN